MTTDLFHDPHRYGDMDAWRTEALSLHAAGPVHRIEAPGFRPFWVVIGHDEVMSVERQPKLFTNAPFPVLSNEAGIAATTATGPQIRTLIHMDDPDHLEYRRLTADWFRPASLDRLTGRLDDLSEQALEQLRSAGGRIDFNREIAMHYPLQVILAILGLPESDYPRMLQLTQELFGATDPDLQRGEATPEEITNILLDFYAYFTGLTADRRADPKDDLASLIANGTIRGEPMPELEQMGYYTIVATAGHDTTAASMAEGMYRLATNPDQLALLQEHPELMSTAVDEMIRLSSPVRHFMRHAQDDTEIAGTPIARGDWVMLNYTAANLDPRIFDDPLRFDVTRHNADRHIAFGFGVHFCLGAQLARMELRSLFSHLVPALESVELDGPPATSKAVFVSGHKRLPIRYSLRHP
ncbi:MAG: cytochrome P450 [Ilumatobacteraceae bacterium]